MNFFRNFFAFGLLAITVAVPRDFVQPTRSVINTAGKYDYIVSIPDVHGDLEILLRSLWMAKGEIEKKSDEFDDFYNQVRKKMEEEDDEDPGPSSISTSPRVLLVQTGDIVDRGPASKSCYKAIWAAEKILGWDLVNLFGNHEVMSMAGQADNYAHPEDVAEFGSMKARRTDFGPGGKIWKKLISKFQFMLKVIIPKSEESILFVHAGISVKYIEAIRKKLVPKSDEGDELVDQLNSFLFKEVMRNPKSDYLTSANSPIWTRDLANGSEKKVCNSLLPGVLKLMNVTRIVLGHTPQEKLVTGNRCEGKLLLADVAMSRWMGSGHNGNPSSVLFALSEDGNKLDRVVNLYWKGSVRGEEGQVVDHLLVDNLEDNHPEL